MPVAGKGGDRNQLNSLVVVAVGTAVADVVAIPAAGAHAGVSGPSVARRPRGSPLSPRAPMADTGPHHLWVGGAALLLLTGRQTQGR